MYHPATMSSLAEARRDDLLREASGTRRLSGSSPRARSPEEGLLSRAMTHPRLVAAVAGLLVALGALAL